MMQGDPKIDILMRPVRAAIERHVKGRAAVTEIYNRAYEAVMNSMDVKTGKTYCAYCGAEYPLDDDAATLVSEHIKTCEKHPMRAVEARAEAAEARAERLQAAVDRLMAYRRDNALNFQLEKFDDYLRALEAELKGGEE